MEIDEIRAKELIEDRKWLGLDGRGFPFDIGFYLQQIYVNRIVDAIKINIAREYFLDKPMSIETLKNYSDKCDKSIKHFISEAKEIIINLLISDTKCLRNYCKLNRKHRMENKFTESKGFDVETTIAKMLGQKTKDSLEQNRN